MAAMTSRENALMIVWLIYTVYLVVDLLEFDDLLCDNNYIEGFVGIKTAGHQFAIVSLRWLCFI